MAQFEVIVGNIGTVYSGNDLKQTLKANREYIKQSKSNGCRGSGESVVVMKDGDIWKEYIGTLETEETEED